MTTDPRVANNTGLNFTVLIAAGSLASQQNLTVRMDEWVGSLGYVQFGILALDANGPTVINPLLVLPNGTWVVGDESLPTTADLSLGLEHAQGDWWGATVDGSPWAGPLGWENGTYDLGTPVAQAVVTQGGAVVSGPSLVVGEGAPVVPFSLLLGFPDVFWVDHGSSVLLPDNGQLLDATPPLATVAFTGHDQNSTILPDEVISPGLEPTTQNDALLWGNSTNHSALASDLIGAYTEDPAFATNDTLGISITCTIPNALLPGQVAVEEVALPINTTTVVEIGFSALTYLEAPLTIPEVGVFNDYGRSHSVYLDASDLEESGDVDSILLEQVHGPWWKVVVSGESGYIGFTSYGGIAGDSATNGTFNFGTPTALGVSSRPFFSNGSFATQPTFFWSGNLTPLDLQESFELESENGAWSPPQEVRAWSAGTTQDVLLGPDQNSTLGAATMSLTDGTATHPHFLANGTPLWTSAPQLQGRVGNGTVSDGTNSTVVVWLNGTHVPTPGEVISATSALGAVISPFQFSAAMGAFVATYWTPPVTSATVDKVQLELSPLYFPQFASPLMASATVLVLPEPQLVVSAGFPGGISATSVVAGGTVEILINVTNTQGVPVPGARLVFLSNVSGGFFVIAPQGNPGEFRCSYTPPAVPEVIQVSFLAYATGMLPSPETSLSLTVRPASPSPTTPAAPSPSTPTPTISDLEGLAGASAILVVLFIALSLPGRAAGRRRPPRRPPPSRRTPSGRPAGNLPTRGPGPRAPPSTSPTGRELS